MNKYERNEKSSSSRRFSDEKNKEKIKEKPLYYSDYIIADPEKNIFERYNCLFFFLLSVFVLVQSIIDISYSYVKIDDCQYNSYFISLNDWFRLNGVFGIVYYFFILIVMSVIAKTNDQGYIKMTNNYNENCEKFYKIFATFATVVMLLINSVGCYIYFSYFFTYCKAYTIIVYMWIRLITGFISSIGLIIFINY